MNLLTAVITIWLLIIAIVWCFDYLPEIIEEKRIRRAQLRAEAEEARRLADPELTQEMPGGSFDPDETMELRVKKVRDPKTDEIQVVFVAAKNPPFRPRRRHAKA